MRKWLAAVVALVLLAACSKGERRSRSAASPSPRPSPTASPSAAASRAASLGPSPTQAKRPSSPTARPGAATPTAPAAPPPAAPSDVIRQPAPGDYAYALTGTTTGLTATPQPYPPGSTQTVRVSPGTPVPDGTQYEAVQSSPQEPTVQTTVRTAWYQGRVALLSTLIRLGGLSNYPCTYNPPPVILHSPVVAETFPQQTFTGQCSGTVDVAVSGPETVPAAGREWRTWKVHSRSTFQMGVGLTGTIDTTMWLSPALGQPVKAETAIDAQLLATKMSIRQSTLLRSHP